WWQVGPDDADAEGRNAPVLCSRVDWGAVRAGPSDTVRWDRGPGPGLATGSDHRGMRSHLRRLGPVALIAVLVIGLVPAATASDYDTSAAAVAHAEYDTLNP